MDKLLIQGGRALSGMISIHGAKNAALPILAAGLLCDGSLNINNIPPLQDIQSMIQLLRALGVTINTKNETEIVMDARHITGYHAPEALVKTMRASILLLGPLLSRFGQIKIPFPGGCAIGQRPIDQHLLGLKAMGAEIYIENDWIIGKSKKLTGANIVMQLTSVTGTENIMMAASLAKGKTVIHNAAKEPEIIDLANCLIQMGAQIIGHGTQKITIEGVKRLHSTHYHIMSDRIEASTYLIAAAATRGCIHITDINPRYLQSILHVLKLTGADIEIFPQSIRLDMRNHQPRAVNIKTAPYPGIATDVQAQFCTLNAVAKGSAYIEENIFENRFQHCEELIKMKARIHLKKNRAWITGIEKLEAASVCATDLRAAASLVIAGLLAEDVSEILNIHHMDRGYFDLEKKISQLGGQIKRISVQQKMIKQEVFI
ncbi:MAG: UDP-N-acetylglucosamine 1-carboxyvinyltransferase [Endozoicomonadaceae bacterium]|nr:UDP-N-acetylglucosamine 1-carboxyvinyltransferase [Endozoicomonadaceae bacterium]